MKTLSLPFLFFLLIISLVLSSLFSPVSTQTLSQLNLYLLIPLSFFTGLILSKSPNLITYFKFLTLSLFLISIYYFYLEYSPNLSLLFSGRRFLGPFHWHNQQGALMLVALPLSLYFYIYSKKTYWLAISFFSLLFFLVTYSRASWLSLFFATAFYFSQNYKSLNKSLLTKLSLFTIPLFILIFLFSPVRSRLQSLGTYSTSEHLRTDAAFIALEIFKNHPILGLGPGSYALAYPAYQTTPWLYSRFPHNQALQFLVELGLIGTTILVLILYQIIFPIYKFRSKIFENKFLSALFISVLALSVHSLFDIDQNYVFFIFIFWGLLGILYANSTKTLPSFKFLILPLSSIILTLTFYNHFQVNPYYTTLSQNNLNSLDRAIVLNPYAAEPHFLKALLFEKQNNFQAAQSEYLLAIAKNPYSHPKYHMNLAALQVKMNNPKAAEIILYQAVYSYFPDNADYQALSHLNNQSGFENDLKALYTAYENVKTYNRQ